MSKIKFNILTIAKYFFIIIMFSIIVIILVQNIQNNNKTPNLFGYKFYVILSGSMKPEINVGDIVLIKDAQCATENEIIAYRNNKTVIVHRVIETVCNNGNTQYITKGDNNNTKDILPVSAEQIEGTYIGTIPYGGYIFIYISKYWIFAVGIVIILVIIKLIIGIVKSYKA